MTERELTIEVSDAGTVSGILRRPDEACALLVLAHGAGAGMRHPFMDRMARELADRGVATLRYQFPYMESGSKRPDRPPLAHATVRAAVAAGMAEAGESGGGRAPAPAALPVYAGGKSFGGRMTSGAAAESPLERVAGLVFFGFPLHPAGRPGTDRAEHLQDVDIPMLFLQGTRDALADLDLLRPVLDELGDRATLHVVDGADHSFKVLKRSGRTEDDVMAEIAGVVADFV